ncbi:MAG: hypothetical protein ACRDMZ_19440, partial [Solirubrobacteraceae bacterium]
AAPIPKLADRMPPDAALPRGLQELIEKAMAKSPSERFQSAIELAEAVDGVASARPVSHHDDFSLVPGAPIDAPPRAKSEARIEAKKLMGTAPTMLDVSDAAELIGPPTRRGRPRGSFLGSLVFLAILASGIGAAVWWVKMRNAGVKKAASVSVGSEAKATAPEPRPDSTARAAGAGSSATGSAAAATTASAGSSAADGAGSATGSAAGQAMPGSPADTAGSGDGPGTASGAGSEAVAESGSAEAAGSASSEPAAAPGAASAGSAGNGSSAAAGPPGGSTDDDRPDIAAEIEMDPATADDPAPAASKPSGDADEAANAPKTAEEVERHAPPSPPVARGTTLQGAVQLIKEGKHDLALASLRALWKKNPASAYIPFLLGNLYYDQRWWTVAMEHYGAAIKKNGRYRTNPTINRNVIRMLASGKTARRAQGFLKYTVGRAALPYVRYAAQHD